MWKTLTQHLLMMSHEGGHKRPVLAMSAHGLECCSTLNLQGSRDSHYSEKKTFKMVVMRFAGNGIDKHTLAGEYW